MLARALLHSVARGRDNELFVLLADLFELDDHLDPLIRAVRVACARHHQALIICPWLPGIPIINEKTRRRIDRRPSASTLCKSASGALQSAIVSAKRPRALYHRAAFDAACAPRIRQERRGARAGATA